MDRIDLLKNLIVMALADGQLSETEIRLLSERSAIWGISEEQFHSAMEYAISADAELQIPPNTDEREELLADLIRVMAADGQLHPTEKQLFALAAATMKIDTRRLDEIIDRTLTEDVIDDSEDQ